MSLHSLLRSFFSSTAPANVTRQRARSRRRSRWNTEALEDRALLATFTVTNTLDAGSGSLRQAISDANVGAGADTISFASSLAGETITLTSGELVVTDGLDINGPGADQLTIDANQQSRIFSIDDGNSNNLIDVSISGLTLTGGAADGPAAFSPAAQGGAISTLENLEVDGLFVTGNRALSLGGGIRSAGGVNANLTVLNSTISNNTVGNATELGFAAGLYFFSGGYVANTTLVGNSAASGGSAIDIGQTTPVVVANSTITGNTGGTALRNTNSSNSLTLHNTIVAGNLDAAGNASEISGTVEPASSNNLIGDPATAGGLIHSNNGNILGDGAGNGIAASTIIETTLADNGGPTQTLALIENSPAIDAGSNALAVDQNAVALTVDQRGEERVVDGDGNDTSTVDIGAFERPPTPRIVVTETDGSTAVSESVGIDTIEVSLNRRPDTDVFITIESGDVTEFVVDLRTLTFTSDNWNVPQTVQVMGIDDREFDGDVTSSLTVEVGSGSDAGFSTVAPVVVTVTTTDNEATTPAGQGQAFDNHAPTLSINYVIALQGIFPSQGGGLPESTEPLLGQIVMGGWNFAPRGYAFAEGQLLGISSNTALFSILGTQYGGNGTTTFALPDLRGRVPIGADPANGLPVGTQVGSATVTLAEDNLPSHTHDHAAGTLAATGGGQAFDNQQPALALTAAVRTVGNFGSLGQIVWFAGNFAPGAAAVGQLLQISQNTALFSQLGTIYGGNGQTTFALPDLRGRAAVGFGDGDGLPALSIGQKVGESQTTLDSSHLPAHDHELSGTDTSETGGNQAFTNVSPGLALRYMVSASGLFPSANKGLIDPFIGEIAITAAPFSDPFGWVNTEGQLLQISQNSALFSLLGTTFGGDGQVTFGLPDLRGRFATHFTTTQRLGSEFGSVDVSLTDATLPTHVHEFVPTAEYVVTTATDELNFSNAEVSLREAIVAANYHAGAQDITFAASLIGSTISLTGGQLELADDVTITGPGAAEELMIDAQGLFRVFRVDSGVTATLSDLTVTNGNADFNVDNVLDLSVGGGILNAAGTLTIENVRFIQNDAQFGGGILNSGEGSTAQLSIRDSTFSGNTGVVAGGLGNSGFGGDATASVSGSTFADNSVSGSGGAILNFEAGATLNIVNSTLSNNEADIGGAVFTQNGAVLTFVNSTVVGNTADTEGGGIHGIVGTVTSLHNTILAANVLDNGTASDASGDAFQAASANNLIGDANSAGGLTNDTDGDPATGSNNIVGVDWKTVLENDGTVPILADNGGRTQTVALLPGSPAIDAGDNALAVDTDSVALTNDQRSSIRILDGHGDGTATVDIGAVEAAPPVPPEILEVDANTDVVDGDYSDGELSLREAILIANSRTGADDITFAAGLTSPIELDGRELLITDDLTIQGPGAKQLTIRGSSAAGKESRIFGIDDDDSNNEISVTISGLTLTGGQASRGSGDFTTGSGGAIRSVEDLTVQDSTLSGNTSTEFGGAIFAGGSGSLELKNSTLSGNTAYSGGGLINYAAGGAVVSNSTISGNRAITYAGGGIFNQFDLTITNSTITGNEAVARGGIHSRGNSARTLMINNSIIAGNTIIATGAESNLANFNGRVTTASHSLFGAVHPNTGLIDGDDNNQVGVTNPGLGPLQDNGGPTQTHALMPDSPAIDAGAVIPQALITPTSVTSSTSASDFTAASRLIANTSVTLDSYETVTEFSLFDGWVTADPNGSTGDYFANETAAPVLTISLDGMQSFDQVLIYGGAGLNNNDIREFTLEFSADGGTTYTSPITLTKPRTTSTTRNFTLPLVQRVTANAVRLVVTDNYFGESGQAGGDRVAFNEIRFLDFNAPPFDQRGSGFDRVIDGDGDGNGTATVDIGAFEFRAADLSATAFDAVTDHVLTAETDVTFTVQNSGDIAAGAFDTHIVWSPNSIQGDADDVVIAGSAVNFTGLAAQSTESRTVTVQLDQSALYAAALAAAPTGQPVGTVSLDTSHLFLVIDVSNSVVESDETNNSGQAKLTDSDDITYFPWDLNGNGVVEPLDAVAAIQNIGSTTLSLIHI